MFVEIVAGSGYGRRYVAYKVEDGKLASIVADSGHDNLAGNGFAAEFVGFTINEVGEKIDAIKHDNLVGHAYDGCHACQWQVWMTELEDLSKYSEDELKSRN